MSQKRVVAFLVPALIFLIIFIQTILTQYASKKILGSWDAITPPLQQPTPSAVGITPRNIPTGTLSNDELYAVVKVVDGDTIAVKIDDHIDTIRLIGINTPESVDPRRPVECYGKEASVKATELLSGQSVYLVADPSQGDRDKYNRLLRYVIRQDGLLVNKAMIEEGFAYEYTYAFPYQYQQEFQASEKKAKEQGKGLWNATACNTFLQKTNFVDKDCSDFTSQQEAQNFFISQGGPTKDPHKLDTNRDGVVCESLP